MKISVFYKIVHEMSAILLKLLRYESNILESKTTQHLKDDSKKYA